jgi:gluconokinase
VIQPPTPPVPATPLIAVVMGVSGSGKSTVAAALAKRLGWQWQEGDDLHPFANVAKMAAGQPLTDDDRRPWLAAVSAWIADRRAAGESGVITCSALKRSYRDVLRASQSAEGAEGADGADIVFVYLAGDRDLFAARLSGRHGHFMPPALLESQLATLEPPAPDERAITVDISEPIAAVVEEIVDQLGITTTTTTALPNTQPI